MSKVYWGIRTFFPLKLTSSLLLEGTYHIKDWHLRISLKIIIFLWHSKISFRIWNFFFFHSFKGNNQDLLLTICIIQNCFWGWGTWCQVTAWQKCWHTNIQIRPETGHLSHWSQHKINLYSNTTTQKKTTTMDIILD